MHRVVVTQLLKRGAAIMSRKERDSTSYSGIFEVRLCLGLIAMNRSYVSAGGYSCRTWIRTRKAN